MTRIKGVGLFSLLTFLSLTILNLIAAPLSAANDVSYFNRKTHSIEKEKVEGDLFIRLLYGPLYRHTITPFLTIKFVSKMAGLYQNSSFSKKTINTFVNNHHINLEEFEPTPGRDASDPYANFNEFFSRSYKKGQKSFPSLISEMGAPAEARYLAFQNTRPSTLFPVKGKYLNLSAIFQNNKKLENIFNNGPVLVARLAPMDYHRFHVPDEAKLLESFEYEGPLDSVNPIALHSKNNILSKNQRVVSILETKNFGKLAYIEVGALLVGKIVQSHPEKVFFERGEEKGYFLFGGSTVIIIGEENKWVPAEDLLQNTEEGLETYIGLGDSVAKAQMKSLDPRQYK